MVDRRWRRALSKPVRDVTPAEAPRQVVYDDDSRLDDARTPLAHSHNSAEITDGADAFVSAVALQAWIAALAAANPGKITVPEFPV